MQHIIKPIATSSVQQTTHLPRVTIQHEANQALKELQASTQRLEQTIHNINDACTTLALELESIKLSRGVA